jgi:hypothetical protein
MFQSQKMHHIYDANGKRQTVDQLLHGPNSIIWNKSMSNELGRLAQGNDVGIKATDTIDFIYKNEIPNDRKVTYANFVCDFRPLKSEPYQVRLVVGGDKLPYDDDAGSPAASLLETKLMVNSTISDVKKGARFMTADLKDHFLASPMDKPEYMFIPTKYIPDDIMQRYKLKDKVTNGCVYVKIKRGMYGLKQAALLAYNHLVNNLASYGYRPIPHTIGLWKHDT